MQSSTLVRATPRFLLRAASVPPPVRNDLGDRLQAQGSLGRPWQRPVAAIAASSRSTTGVRPRPRLPAAAWRSTAGLRRRSWLGRLRRALEREEFVLHYQPIVSLSDRRVSHYEALVRLADDPEGGLVGPSAFLPDAERYGLIVGIDRLVVEKVAAMLASEGPDSQETIAVNLSAVSVTDPGMLPYIEGRLAHHALAPSRLVLELTETAPISDMGRAREFCAGAQALGCSIALDDFGAGFGALQYLKHLPFCHLKIDGVFIRDLPRSRHDQLLVRALADLARAMGGSTIAECVEDRATLSLLGELGVDCAQGFEVGPPRPRAISATGTAGASRRPTPGRSAGGGWRSRAWQRA